MRRASFLCHLLSILTKEVLIRVRGWSRTVHSSPVSGLSSDAVTIVATGGALLLKSSMTKVDDLTYDMTVSMSSPLMVTTAQLTVAAAAPGVSPPNAAGVPLELRFGMVPSVSCTRVLWRALSSTETQRRRLTPSLRCAEPPVPSLHSSVGSDTANDAFNVSVTFSSAVSGVTRTSLQLSSTAAIGASVTLVPVAATASYVGIVFWRVFVGRS